MRYGIGWLACAATALVACGGEVRSEHARTARDAVSVGSACTSEFAPAAAYGLVAHADESRRADGAFTATITNHAATARRVRVRHLHVDVGFCHGLPHKSVPERPIDLATGGAPGEIELAPGAAMEIRFSTAELHPTSPCVKYLLAALLDVDGRESCLDAGAWILPSDPSFP